AVDVPPVGRIGFLKRFGLIPAKQERVRLLEDRRVRIRHVARVAALQFRYRKPGPLSPVASWFEPAVEHLLRQRTAQIERNVDRYTEWYAQQCVTRPRISESRIDSIAESIGGGI